MPKYRRHKQSGQAIVTLSGRDHLLGKWQTKASKLRYDRLVAEWLVRDRQPLTRTAELSVAEFAALYWAAAKKKYSGTGRPAAEQFHIPENIKRVPAAATTGDILDRPDRCAA